MKFFRMALLFIGLSYSYQQLYAVNFKAIDPYEFLEVPRDVDEKTLKSVFRQAALKYHPSRNKSDPEATRRMQAINDAHERVLNDRKRVGWKKPTPLSPDDLIRMDVSKKRSYDLITELKKIRELEKTNPSLSTEKELRQKWTMFAAQELVERKNPGYLGDIKSIVVTELNPVLRLRKDAPSYLSYAIIAAIAESKDGKHNSFFVKVSRHKFNENSVRSTAIRDIVATSLAERINYPDAKNALRELVKRSKSDSFRTKFQPYFTSENANFGLSKLSECIRTNLASLMGKWK